MKRILAVLLMVTMLLCSLGVPASAEMDNYASAIRELYLYMSNPTDSGLDINNIIQDFSILGNKGFSGELKLYTTMVRCIIDEDDLSMAKLYADVLEEMHDFASYLENDENGLEAYMRENCGINDGNRSVIPVRQIKAYIEGREAEKRGDADTAREQYLKCTNFYDARGRLIAVLEQQTYVDKEAIFKQAMERYAKGDLEEAAQLLIQIKDDHATAKSLYEIVIAELTKSVATPTPEPTATPKPTSVPASKPKSTPKATSTPKADNKPKATTAPAPVAIYSDWVADVPDGANIVDIKTQYRNRSVATEYRYRDLITKTSTESYLGDGWTPVSSELVYGAWSDYSVTPISASATLEVEQSTRDVQKEVTVWNYSRWEYKHVDYPNLLYYSCVDYSKQNPAKVAKVYGWKYTSSTNRFTNTGSKGGCVWYKSPEGVTWYNESSSTKTETQQVTMYRSRSKTMRYTYQSWSSWSDWSRSQVNGSSTKQVETRKAYGSWSAWQDGKLEGGEVQTRKMYRYRIQ